MIELKNINISFGKKECIKNGHFKAYPYQITSIIGESGTGKSSLLYLIAMLTSKSCKYYYNGKLLELNEKDKNNFRNKEISFISQDSILIDTISVEENIKLYLQMSKSNYTVDDLLKEINLQDKKHAMPNNLSGGERQRVALACAIAKDSKIILGDEITSALDDENKKMVTKILRKCANQGKIVILVSHEDNIIENSDRVYRIEHLELILEKETSIDSNTNSEVDNRNNTSCFRIFKNLFYSNKKYNLRRLLISVVVMSFIFLSASIFVTSNEKLNNENYSTNNLSINKLLAVSDESGFFHQIDGQLGCSIHFIENQEPLDTSIINQLNNLDHIKKSYDYYTFNYSMSSGNGIFENMTIKVFRDNKEILKRSNENTISVDKDYPFSIIPFFPEDEFVSNDSGIYVNSNMAYYYNIEVGDILELEINVPYTMLELNSQETSTFDDNIKAKTYYPVSCLGNKVPYKDKVIGIIDSNSQLDNEVYLHHSIMEKMINEQVEKYQKNEIEINYNIFEGYSSIMDLKPYAKAIFVDKKENVLKVQNDINEISDAVFAYNEYQSILELENNSEQIKNDTIKLAIVCILIIVTGVIIIEIFYLKKYKSTYMMLKLIGYSEKKKNKIFIIHGLYQGLIILCTAMIVYIIGSIPLIIALKTKENILLVRSSFPDFYNTFTGYAVFSWQHFIFFTCILGLILIISHFGMKVFYDRIDTIKWLRGK
ncbi:ATP-binding cassette domain-containing protein [Thomasclavelia spiroformis]|uniref:ATP-binding cassette domain-containing protein n=1 Tax=Thomasclavelia spiroformis TaxID=29348 RepID=UPI002432093F|nr:ATP-binding cassette domain-containing protein [Thomasclavelia spiroformis]